MDIESRAADLPDAPEQSRAIPPDARALAARLKARGAVRHILYVSGTGNVASTYEYWRAGRDDPGIPSIAYSQQIYEVADALGASVSVLSAGEIGQAPEGPVRFAQYAKPRSSGVRFHLDEIGYAFGLVARARRAGADLILLQRNLTHFWPMTLAGLYGIDVVYSLHNTLWPAHRGPGLRERLLGWLNGFAFRRSRGVLGVSPSIVAQVRRVAGEGRVQAIAQVPQYKESFAHLPRVRRDGRRGMRLIYVGRVQEWKGVFLLLEAFARLAPNHPGLTLDFVGDGRDLDRLKAAAAALPDADRITFAGQIGGTEVFRRLAEADLLVCPTTAGFAEGLAKTPVEAAMVGLPSLITTVVPAGALLKGAVREIPPGDAGAIEAALDDMLRHPEVLAGMAAAADERVGVFFDRANSLAARLLELLARGRRDA